MKFIVTIVLNFFCLLASAQYQHDSLKAADGYLHYYTKGIGPAIVLLQGGPGFSSYYMRGIADSLDGYKTVLIDYQGTGRSQYRKADTSWVNIEQIVKDVETVRKKLNINKWSVLGHSYGGMFALYYGLKYPQQVDKIIPIANAGTNNKFQSHYVPSISRRLSAEQMQQLQNIQRDSSISNIAKEGMIMELETSAMFFDQKQTGKLLNYFPASELPIVMNNDFFDAYISQVKYYRQFDITKQVLQMQLPVRMIESWQDPNYDGRQWVLNEKMKNSKIEFINKSGHFAWIEQPQIFFKILRQFLIEPKIN